MRRLILHIGSHKTGTSSLQMALIKAAKAGMLPGWRYPSGQNRNPPVSFEGDRKAFSLSLRRKRLDKMTQGDDDVILSSEGFFWLYRQPQIERLATMMRERFDDIRVVAYLRRQDTLALSHRKQVVLGRPAMHFYGIDVAAMPTYRPYFARYFDYAAKLAMWEAAFGAGALTVRRFQKADLHQGDTVADFFHHMGLGTPPAVEDRNTAWTQGQIMAGLWLRDQGGPLPDKLEPLLAKTANGTTLLPARAEAEAFLAHFEASNRHLAERYDPAGPAGYFDTDMSKYPETGNDALADLDIDLEALKARIAG